MKNFILYLYLAVCCPLLAFSHAGIKTKNLPRVLFVENKGQVTDQYNNQRKDIDFRLQGRGVNVFIGNGKIHYQWTKATPYPPEGEIDVKTSSPSGEDRRDYKIYRLDVELVGANPEAELVIDEQQSYTEHYYLAQCPGGVHARSFRKVTYRNIYPNIDWTIYVAESQIGNQKSYMKYDFVVRKGGNINDIKMQYNGADSMLLHEGALTAFTPFGNISEQAPYTYEVSTGRQIEAAYKLTGNTISFDVEQSATEIVIDPAINWATYYGGPANDVINKVMTDKFGNVYVTGFTASMSNMATTGAFQQSLANIFRDGFIAKLREDGSRVWSTYYGGNYDDEFMCLAIDASGNTYIGGITQSPGMATMTTGIHQVTLSGNKDAFITKFDGAGNRIWATYYGGSGNDSCVSIAVSPSADALYIGGRTSSANGIATVGSNPLSDNNDAFFAKINPTDGSRDWGQYHVALEISGLACDAGNVYLAGSCLVGSGVTSTGAHQVIINSGSGGGLSDGVLAKYNSSGGREWATYYGGEANDYCYALTLDALGNIYLAGSGFSMMTGSIATSGAYQITPGGGEDAFIAKFNNAGVRQWGTYYGGLFQDGVYGITLDGSGNIYITGETLSPAGIATTISHQHNFGGGARDGFMAQFSNDGTELKWGTYYGGKSDDIATGVAYDVVNKAAYICGLTTSDSSIATKDGLQPLYNQGGDGFLASFTADSPYVFINAPFNDTVFCAGDSFLVPYTAVEMQLGNIVRIQLSNASGSFASPVTIGSTNTLISGIMKCGIPAGAVAGAGYRIRVVSTNPVRVSADNGTNIRVDRFLTAPEASNNSPLCEGQKLQFEVKDFATGITVYWDGPGTISNSIQNPAIEVTKLSDSGQYTLAMTFGACERLDTTMVKINPNPPQIPISSNSPVCEAADILLRMDDSTSTVPFTRQWMGPESFNDTSKAPFIANVTVKNAGVYTLRTVLGSCTKESTTAVEINPTPEVPVITTNSPVAIAQELRIDAVTSTPGVTYSWIGPDSFFSTSQNVVIAPTPAAAAGTYKVTVSLGNCSSSAIALVTVIDKGKIGVYPNPTKGVFTMTGSFKKDQTIPIRIVNRNGQVVHEDKVTTVKQLVNATITLPAYLSNGVYTLQIRADNDFKAYNFVLEW